MSCNCCPVTSLQTSAKHKGNLYFPWFCLQSRCTFPSPFHIVFTQLTNPDGKTKAEQNNLCQPAIFNISCGFRRAASHWLLSHARLQKAQEMSMCLWAGIIRKCSSRLQLLCPLQSVIKDSFCLFVPLKWLPCGICLLWLRGCCGRHWKARPNC